MPGRTAPIVAGASSTAFRKESSALSVKTILFKIGERPLTVGATRKKKDDFETGMKMLARNSKILGGI